MRVRISYNTPLLVRSLTIELLTLNQENLGLNPSVPATTENTMNREYIINCMLFLFIVFLVPALIISLCSFHIINQCYSLPDIHLTFFQNMLH